MRSYRNYAWDLIENFFLTFNIHAIPRQENKQVDSLVVAASTFRPPEVSNLKYEIEMKYKPSIPDNVKHWQVFEDDQQIKKFLEMIDEFSTTHIDQEDDQNNEQINQNSHPDPKLQDMIANHKMMVLRNNQIPKGLVPLEKLFDKDDIVVKPIVHPQKEEVEDHNIGTEQEPRYIKLSKFLPVDQKVKYIDLFKEFTEVFAWSYEDLKTYDTNIIQHKIPLKVGSKPFRHKLRQVNPILFPVIEKELKKLLDAKIIVPLRYSSWVANLVPVRKKNGEIRLCV
jgi:hypothetical protein